MALKLPLQGRGAYYAQRHKCAILLCGINDLDVFCDRSGWQHLLRSASR